MGVTAVVSAMATHICLCFALSTCVSPHIDAHTEASLPVTMAYSVKIKRGGAHGVKSFCKWLMIYAADSVHFVSVPRLNRMGQFAGHMRLHEMLDD